MMSQVLFFLTKTLVILKDDEIDKVQGGARMSASTYVTGGHLPDFDSEISNGDPR